MIKLFRVAAVGCLVLTLSFDLCAQQENRQLEYHEDVVYGKGGDVELHMDIASRKDLNKPAPCILVIHGGAWRGGDKRDHRNEVFALASQGYVAATVQYRFCPDYRFPAQVEDVKCAIRYLRKNAEQYGIDPSRIGALGFSAGAHLAMMLGTMDSEDGLEGDGGWPDQSSKVQAVVSFFGPTELGAEDMPARSLPLVKDLIGGSREAQADAYRRASPISYVNKGDAAMLLFQGTADVLVPYSQAIKMVTAMTEADVPGRVEFLIDAGHGWGGKDRDRTIEATNSFFRRYLQHDAAD